MTGAGYAGDRAQIVRFCVPAAPAKRSITFGIGHRLASSQRLSRVAPSISLLILGSPVGVQRTPITRCRRHSLATEILRAGRR